MKYLITEEDLQELIWDSILDNKEVDIKKFETDTVNLYNAIKSIPDATFREDGSMIHGIQDKKDLINDLIQSLEINFIERVCENFKRRLKEDYKDNIMD